jgi:CubicO group peptidase (beta-lactamase class C family)
MMPQGKDYAGPKSFYEFLQTLQKEGEHDQGFAYKTVNAEVLAWIVRRASGKPLAQLLSERIWSRIGAEQDAYFMVDRIGTESGGGGLNTTLRDLARFGELMRNEGRAASGQQVLPRLVVQDRNAAPTLPSLWGRLCHAARLVVSQYVVGLAQPQRGLYGARHSRSGHLHRPQGPDGGGALRLPPDCGQCGHRPDQPAHVPGAGRCADRPLGTRQLQPRQAPLTEPVCIAPNLCTVSCGW